VRVGIALMRDFACHTGCRDGMVVTRRRPVWVLPAHDRAAQDRHFFARRGFHPGLPL